MAGSRDHDGIPRHLATESPNPSNYVSPSNLMISGRNHMDITRHLAIENPNPSNRAGPSGMMAASHRNKPKSPNKVLRPHRLQSKDAVVRFDKITRHLKAHFIHSLRRRLRRYPDEALEQLDTAQRVVQVFYRKSLSFTQILNSPATRLHVHRTFAGMVTKLEAVHTHVAKRARRYGRDTSTLFESKRADVYQELKFLAASLKSEVFADAFKRIGYETAKSNKDPKRVHDARPSRDVDRLRVEARAAAIARAAMNEKLGLPRVASVQAVREAFEEGRDGFSPCCDGDEELCVLCVGRWTEPPVWPVFSYDDAQGMLPTVPAFEDEEVMAMRGFFVDASEVELDTSWME